MREALKLQFRAEFSNMFNLVNFGLRANIVLGPVLASSATRLGHLDKSSFR